MNCFCTPPPCPQEPTNDSTPQVWAEYALWIVRYGRPEMHGEQRFALPDRRVLRAVHGDTLEDVLRRLEDPMQNGEVVLI